MPGTLAGEATLDWTALGNTGWKPVGTGHFNHDEHLDVLWHKADTGELSVWYLNGTRWVGGNGFSNWTATEASGWKVVGTGDFNRDGNTDVLWHKPDTGEVGTWLLDGTNVTSNPFLNKLAKQAEGFYVRGAGDFDGDGHTDVVVHNWQTQQVIIWYLNGTNVVREGVLSWNIGGSTGWQIVGTGDYNHDGKLDVLWYEGWEGRVGAWNLDGTTVTGTTDFVNRSRAEDGWSIVSR